MAEQAAPQPLYLFCCARAGALSDAVFEASDLLTHRCGGLMAVCEWTGMEQWSGAQAEQRMRDLQWLAPKAMRHQAVVAAAMRNSPVLPARMGTLFSSTAALERFLDIHRGTITAFLDEMQNKQEWSVKCFLDRARLSQWLAATMAAAPGDAPASGGARYLHERRIRAAAARELNSSAARILEPIAAELRRHAASCCQRAIMPAAAGEPQPILNLACLVTEENLTNFRGCAQRATDEHRDRGLALAVSGPWPPYSFCPTLEMPS
jgi:hypothetical protein